MSKYQSTLKNLYKDILKLPMNQECLKCPATTKEPLLPFVGDKFDGGGRFMFVRVGHQEDVGTLTADGYRDLSTVIRSLWNTNRDYFRLLRLITEPIYGKEGFRYISLSELVKCTMPNEAEDQDYTTIDLKTLYGDVIEWMIESCYTKQRIIWQDIKAIKPNAVVFLYLIWSNLKK
ncbi:MAG: hypothetical protein HQL94_07570 [Magnetococcales bacterium]|nr:hypothetical protein [Magnetococcales bacterium]